MRNTLNSRSLWEIAKTYVIDGRCVKSRNFRKEFINEKMIEEMVQAHDNIVIQEGQEIKIYCNDEFFKAFNQVVEYEKQFNHSSNLFAAYQKGEIEIFVKYSKKKPDKEDMKDKNIDRMVLIGLIEIFELLNSLDSI